MVERARLEVDHQTGMSAKPRLELCELTYREDILCGHNREGCNKHVEAQEGNLHGASKIMDRIDLGRSGEIHTKRATA